MISVIIPAFNAETTIIRCVNSIQRQTYSNLEIIIVNDGSKDTTEKAVKSLQEKDNRIKLITIPNGGVSHARNIGIDNATGEYIAFVDSDDYIDAEMYENLVEIIRNYNVKIAHCSYKNVNENGNLLSVVGDTGKITEQDHNEAMSCILSGNFFAGGLCNKLFSASLFDGVRLNEDINFNEDVLTNYYLFDKVEKSVYSDRALYNYVVNNLSATHSANPVNSGEECLYVAKQMLKKSIGKPYERCAKTRVSYNALVLYRAYLFSDGKSVNGKRKKLKSEILEWNKEGFYINKKEKLTVLMYRFIPHLYKLLYKVYDKVRIKRLDPEQ